MQSLILLVLFFGSKFPATADAVVTLASWYRGVSHCLFSLSMPMTNPPPQQVNFLDTAEMYPVPTNAETQGYTDRTIAAWLKQRPASFRDDVVLATKVRECVVDSGGGRVSVYWLRKESKRTFISFFFERRWRMEWAILYGLLFFIWLTSLYPVIFPASHRGCSS
jgi:hypothetical protein